ncbi:MAG: 50S ribosomal protein L25 [Chloroflexi bacterium]|nr:50S ribosomal protein L25 [Chloroflexota bacterium]
MERIQLQANVRETLGKKVRFLRRQGITPVHVFGGIESVALQCAAMELRHVLAEAGKTRLIDLNISGSGKPANVVVREVQRNQLTRELLHVDFYQVRMEEKIRVEVPIALVGEAPALKAKGTILAQEMHILAIECLPDRIPARVEIDLSGLELADQAFHVKDIVLGEGIAILDDPERIVVKVSMLVAEKEEAVEAPTEAVQEAAAPEEESPEE